MGSGFNRAPLGWHAGGGRNIMFTQKTATIGSPRGRPEMMDRFFSVQTRIGTTAPWAQIDSVETTRRVSTGATPR